MSKSKYLREFSLAAAFAATIWARATMASPPLDAYGDLENVEDVAISPNGEMLAVAGMIGEERRVILLDGSRKLIAARGMGDLKFQSVSWAGDEFAVVRLRDTVNLGMYFTADKAELSAAAIIPVDGSEIEGVFGKTPSIAKYIQGSYGFRNVNGNWTGYFGGVKYRREGKTGFAFDHGRPFLFAVELRKNRPHQVAAAAAEEHWRDWLVDGAGEVAATLDVSSVTGEWKIQNVRGRQIASGVERTGGIDLISLGKDGLSAIYKISDDVNEVERLMEVPLSGGTATEILEGVDIKRFYIDGSNGHLLGYLPESSDKTVLFDLAKQEILNKVYRAFPGLKTTVIEWAPSFSHFIVHTSGNGDSGTWFLVDIRHLKAEPIGYDRPLIGPEAVGPISVEKYTADDGLEMDGILTLPPGREAKNLPIIIMPHGGPSSHDEARFDWWSQAFASRGYAVFQPNFRGSTNRDLAFARAGFGQWGRKMQSDISDGLKALADRGIVDSKRACIMGASYGGYAALAGVTLQQGLYRCAVAVAPVSDVRLMYRTDQRESNNDKMQRRALIAALGDPSLFDEISPRRFADKADAPILLIHGKDDTRVPFTQSRVMADALRDAGKPHELVVLEDEDHFLSRAPTRKQVLNAAMRFVEKHNPAD